MVLATWADGYVDTIHLSQDCTNNLVSFFLPLFPDTPRLGLSETTSHDYLDHFFFTSPSRLSDVTTAYEHNQTGIFH
jgi:hypothetical protein